MQAAIDRQPLRKTIPLGHLEVVNTGVVNINGVPVPMNKKAFSQLARILGVPIQFQGRVDKLFGEDATRSIVNRMKSALAAQGISQVTVSASPTSKEIIGFTKRESEYITNSSFFEVAQEIIHDHDLLVRDFSINGDNGLVTLSCFNPDANFQIGNHKDEFFQGGITLSNSFDKGLVVSPYMNRLVCLNGMIGDIILSLARKRKDKIEGTGNWHIMKNRYGADGMTFRSRINTSNGYIDIDNSPVDDDDIETSSSNKAVNNFSDVGAEERQLLQKKFFKLEN